MDNYIYTKVIMDSGKEYIFQMHPEDFLDRVVNKTNDQPYEGFVHFVKVSIIPSHISSIEEIDSRKVHIPDDQLIR